MHIETLEEIATLAVHRNVSKTASLLNISQPVLSKRILAAEKELGFALFTRGDELQLTAAGARFVSGIQEITNEYRSLCADSFLISKQEPPAKLCATRTKQFEQLLRTASIPFLLVPDDGTRNRISLLASNTVDLAFSYGHDIDTIRRLYNVPDIEGVQIGEERQTVVTGANNPLLRHLPLSAAELEGRSFCTWSTPSVDITKHVIEQCLGIGPLHWINRQELNVLNSALYFDFGNMLFVGAYKELHAMLSERSDIVFIDELDGKPLMLKVYCLYRAGNKNSNARKLAEALASQPAYG